MFMLFFCRTNSYALRGSSCFIKFEICLIIILELIAALKGATVTKFPPLIYATHQDIRLASAPKKTSILVKNLLEGSALDFNYSQKRICWTDHDIGYIQCVGFDGIQTMGPVKNITATGPITAESLAIDWYTGNMYWTDGELDTIEVANSQGQHRRVLYWTELDQPRAIVVVPMKGFIFWTDWGEVPKIERASMNGDQTTRQVIVSENIFWPNGMTVDYKSEKIYWLDGRHKFIAVMDYNGQSRKTILNDKLLHPFAITYFENKVFWTDWASWSVYTINVLLNTSKPQELFHSEIVPMTVHVWNANRQPPGSNPCQKNNGGCSHLCLISPNPPYYNCSCPTGILLKDEHTCRNASQYILLLAQRGDISKISLDTPDYTNFVIPLNEIKHTIAVDYDPVDDFLYWTDDEVRKIRRAKLDGTQEQDVIVGEIEHPDGIAVDWIARNIYWTDTGTDRIEVSRLNGTSRKVIINEALGEPRAIAVAPVHGWLFWTDWNDKNPKIERASLDGSERVILVSTDLGWPNGLALDLENSKVYWGDANKDKIEVANMDGTDRRVVINDNLPHLFGLSLLDNYLYWTDWQRRSIDKVKITGRDREVIIEPLPNIMGLKAVHLGKVTGTNGCAINNGGCSHLCLNRPQGYICACQIEHELSKDNRTCIVPEVFLLFARKENIGRISIENGNKDIIPVTGIKSPRSLDFDFTSNRIYWTDVKAHAIMRAYLNGSEMQYVVEQLGIGSPESVAVDWLAQNIYWTNSESKRIEMARLGGSSRRTLVWKNIDNPATIVLDPVAGYIFWSEIGETNRISRAAMDGSNVKIIVTNAGKVQGLVLDHATRSIFWGDRESHVIRTADYDGNGTKDVVSHVDDPYSLTLYKDKIYWSDRKHNDIEFASKVNGGNRSKIINQLEKVDDLIVFHATRQTGWNQCSVNNGGCSHLCLSLPSGNHTCGCPTHYTLNASDNSTCVAPQSYLIFSQRNMVSRLIPDTPDCPDAVLSLQGMKNIRAIEYDPETHFLYWIDGKTQVIRRAFENGSHASVVVRDLIHPYDLALDPIGRLLFWSCAELDMINVTRLNNDSSVGVVVQATDVKPRNIAVHPIKRLLFWTDIGVSGQIVAARMDGSKRIPLASGLLNPTAITVDLETDLVFWSLEKMIYVSDLTGEHIRHLYISSKAIHISEIAVLGRWLYWIDKERQQIERVDKKTGQKHTDSILPQKSQNLVDIIAVRSYSKEIYENHTCSTKNSNGKCSHLCVWRPDDMSEVCACPLPLLLHDNKQTCLAKHDCGPEYFTCASVQGRDCLPISWRCDGQKDCPDESDEQGCPECGENEFKCRSGQCIDRAWVCDGTTQCPDGHDEANCCENLKDFQCPSSDVCIPVYALCDNWEHCADGADEAEALCSKVSPVDGNSQVGNKSSYLIVIIVGIGSLILVVLSIYYCHVRLANGNQLPYDQATDPLSPPGHSLSKQEIISGSKLRQNGAIRMSMLSGSLASSYDRSHITGASSSTNGSGCYPRETLNPPPSPATTAASTRASSSVSRHRPYRYYRTINQPPPPTPCSTDVCDESDSNYQTRGRYNEPFPPPPTPRSHCHTESCPPSPSSRSSTNFSPLPPPPSPVPSPPRGYDS